MLKRVGTNLSTLPLRHLGGGAIPGLRNNFTRTERYNYTIGDGVTSKLAGLPNGHLTPSSWILPYRPGGISSSKEARIVFNTPNLNVNMGRNLQGSSSIEFVSLGNGAAVASLIGSSTITFVTTGSVSAPFNMVGSSTIQFSTTGVLSGAASLISNSSISFSSSLTTYAIAHLIATPIDTSLTPSSISSAVWSAAAISNNSSGSMGEKLNDAGSAGNPWSADLSTNNTPGTFGGFIQKLLTVGKFLGLK